MAKIKSIDYNTSKNTSKPKNVVYRVCLFYNNKRNKILLETKDRFEAMTKFNELLSISNKVEFPKKFISSRGIKPLESELLLLKSLNTIGNNPPERIHDGCWKIVKRESYFVEETFTVYGLDEKLTARGIIKHLNSVVTPHREIGVLNNKIVIFNESFFDLIVAKCPEDALRLMPFIYENNGKHKNFFNRGEYMGYDKRDIITLIVEETNWPRPRVNRRFTDFS